MKKNIIPVATSSELQDALNTSAAGDVIVLTAGTVYSGNFTLPNRGVLTGWITLRSSTADSLPRGRVSPADKPKMATIVTPNGAPAISAAAAANHYLLDGLEIQTGAGIYTNDLVCLNGDLTTLEGLPSDIIIDRCYIRGDPAVGSKRGVAANCKHLTVRNSYISDFMSTGQDTQAIGGWNGPGPFTITNNYLEASGENVMFGGAAPKIPTVVPSDITIEGNYFFKPLSWRVDDPSYAGTPWNIKNLLELKSAQRVTIRRNMFENCWVSAQVGFAIQFTVRVSTNIDPPPEVVNHVVFSENVILNAINGFNFLGIDSNGLGVSYNVSITDNVLLGLSEIGFQVLKGMKNLTIKHNTGMPPVVTVMGDSVPSTGFIFQDNMMSRGRYGIFGSGSSEGIPALEKYFPGSIVQGNVLIGADPALYPPGNHFPATPEDVGFVDYEGGNLALNASSPYINAALDGKQVGADVPAVMAWAEAAKTAGSPPEPPLEGPRLLGGYWNFDEGSGTVAHDVSGGGHDAEITGAEWAPGKHNSGLLFDGSTSKAVTSPIPIGDAFSICVWVNPLVRPQRYYTRIAETRYDTGFFLGTDGGGSKYKFIVKGGAGATGGGQYGSAEGGSVTADNWQHVAATYDGAVAKLYVDSALVATETFTSPGDTNYPLYIGQHYGGPGYSWNGALDEIQLYNRALTAEEIVTIFATR